MIQILENLKIEIWRSESTKIKNHKEESSNQKEERNRILNE